MNESTDRITAFEADIAELGLAAGPVGRERLLQRVGGGLLVLGPIIAVIAYFVSFGTSDPREQRDALIVAIIGLSVAVSGGFLFLRYSMANFLRFWMLRLVHEQRGSLERTESSPD